MLAVWFGGGGQAASCLVAPSVLGSVSSLGSSLVLVVAVAAAAAAAAVVAVVVVVVAV